MLMDAALSAAEGISTDAARARRMAGIPVQRYGSAADFGAACAFLCSEDAGYITGQQINLNGGRYM